MTRLAYTLFDTAVGRCAIVWGARGIVYVQLPEARESATRARLRRRFPEAREAPLTPEVERALCALVALLRGEPSDLSDVALDIAGVPPFDRRVYEVARTIPAGATLRVVAAGGELGGFSAHGGGATKLRLLAIEGERAPSQPGLFDGDARPC